MSATAASEGPTKEADVVEDDVDLDVEPRFPVGRILRDQRRALGLTQEEAAERAGISVGAWRSTESGTRRPRPHTFAAILELLGLTPELLHSRAEQLRRHAPENAAARAALIDLCREDLPSEAVVPILDIVELIIVEARSEGAADART